MGELACGVGEFFGCAALFGVECVDGVVKVLDTAHAAGFEDASELFEFGGEAFATVGAEFVERD